MWAKTRRTFLLISAAGKLPPVVTSSTRVESTAAAIPAALTHRLSHGTPIAIGLTHRTPFRGAAFIKIAAISLIVARRRRGAIFIHLWTGRTSMVLGWAVVTAPWTRPA
jgi:hypothetical protein